jgi:hypothetical protein
MLYISCLITGANHVGELITIYDNEIKNKLIGELMKRLGKRKSESLVRLRYNSGMQGQTGQTFVRLPLLVAYCLSA